MNRDVKRKYVNLHQQGWIPIFVNDRLNALRLADICVQCGCTVVEVTCRRPGVVEEIRAIRRSFPDLIILAGSVVDHSVLLPYLRGKKPGFPTMEQLADAGADGFVSQLPMSPQTMMKYAETSLLIPGVETLSEAVTALNAGAHFAKFVSSPPSRIKLLSNDAVHRLIPIFYTGGAHPGVIPEYVRAGAALIGGGWDIMLADEYETMQAAFDAKTAADRLGTFMQAVRDARSGIAPYKDHSASMTPDDYLQSLIHYHPFDELPSSSISNMAVSVPDKSGKGK